MQFPHPSWQSVMSENLKSTTSSCFLWGHTCSDTPSSVLRKPCVFTRSTYSSWSNTFMSKMNYMILWWLIIWWYDDIYIYINDIMMVIWWYNDIYIYIIYIWWYIWWYTNISCISYISYDHESWKKMTSFPQIFPKIPAKIQAPIVVTLPQLDDTPSTPWLPCVSITQGQTVRRSVECSMDFRAILWRNIGKLYDDVYDGILWCLLDNMITHDDWFM